MTLGDIIYNYRTEHKMSMDAFADRSGMSKAYISLLEKNKHPKTGKPIAPSIKVIKQSAEAMRMDFNELHHILKPPKRLLFGGFCYLPVTYSNRSG